MPETTDQLMNDARCIDKCIPDGMKLAVLISIFQQLLTNGTGGGGGGGLPTGPQAANTVLAGPTSGAAAAPTFRALVNADFATTLTPQIAQLGLGVAPSGTIPLTVLVAGIANTSTDGVFIENTTAATVGVQIQKSPAIHFKGSVWNTTSVSSNATEWQVYGRGLAGTNPVAVLNFDSSLNGGAFANRLRIGSDGSVGANQFQADGFFSVGAGGTPGLTQTFSTVGGDTQITFIGGIATAIA